MIDYRIEEGPGHFLRFYGDADIIHVDGEAVACGKTFCDVVIIYEPTSDCPLVLTPRPFGAPGLATVLGQIPNIKFLLKGG